jgi:hypothetical protein
VDPVSLDGRHIVWTSRFLDLPARFDYLLILSVFSEFEQPTRIGRYVAAP